MMQPNQRPTAPFIATSPMKQLGEVIQRYRIARDLDHRGIADRCGVKAQLVKEWEEGTAVPESREWARLVNMVAHGLRNHRETWAAALQQAKQGASVKMEVAEADLVLKTNRPSADASAPVVDAAQPPRIQAPEDAKTFGEALRRARSIAGLAQHELGALIGVEQSSVSVWELGKGNPVEENFEAIFDLFPVLRGRWAGLGRKIPKPLGPSGQTFPNVHPARGPDTVERAAPVVATAVMPGAHGAPQAVLALAPVPVEPALPEPPPRQPTEVERLSMAYGAALLRQSNLKAQHREQEAALARLQNELLLSDRSITDSLAALQAAVKRAAE